MTRVIITGSRHWQPTALAARVVATLARRHVDLLIVHGGCRGVDTTFGEACFTLGIQTEVHLADWDRYGKSAGPRRNKEMVALGAAYCLAFHNQFTAKTGTADCCRQAIAAGIPTWLTTAEDGRPQRLTTI